MRHLAIALFSLASLAVAGQASAAPIHHHKPVCHIEHKKVKVHGHWVVKNIKVCR